MTFRHLFACLLFPWLLAAQSLTVVGDGAFVSAPNSTLELAVTARTAAGALASNIPVVFAAPLDRAAGVATARFGQQTWLSATTGADGVARAQVQLGPGAGYLTICGSALETRACFAISVGITAPTPATTIAQARAAARQAGLANAPDSGDLQLIGPYLLAAGSTVQPALAGRSQTFYPRRLENAGWFFWADRNVRARWQHDALYLFLPGTVAPAAAAARLELAQQSWWPELIPPNGTGRQSLSPGEARNESASLVNNISSGRLQQIEIQRGLELLANVPPEQACVILAMGPEVAGAARDLMSFRDYLESSNQVAPGNVLTNTTVSGETRLIRPMTKAQFKTRLREAAARGCKKLFIGYAGHGSDPNYPGGGGLCMLKPPEGPDGEPGLDSYPYTELVADIAAIASGMEVCMIVDACYSGQLVELIQGQGITGGVLTAADENHTAFGSTRGGGTTTKVFVPSLQRTGGDFSQAATDASNSMDPNVKGPGARYGMINPMGGAFFSMPFVSFNEPGQNSPARISRPGIALPAEAWDGYGEVVNPGIGRYDGMSARLVQYARNVPPFFNVNVSSVDVGFTPVKGEWNNVTGRVKFTGRHGGILVGSARVSPLLCTITLGDPTSLCTETIERIIPVPERDDAGFFQMFILDEAIVAVSKTKIDYKAGEKNFDFAITGKQVGSTKVLVWDSQSGLYTTILVNVVAAPIALPGTAPQAPADGTFLITLNATGGDLSHFIPIGGAWWRSGINVSTTVAPGTTNTRDFTLRADGVSQFFNLRGVIDFVTGVFSASGTGSAAGFNTSATATGKISFGPNALKPGVERQADFNYLQITYTLGTNGAFPGGQPIIYTGGGPLQGAGACQYQLAGPATTAPRDAARVVVALRTQASCSATAASSQSWATVQAPVTGTGPRNLVVNLAANPGAARSVNITAGGASVTVNQAGVTTGAPSITAVVNGASFGDQLAPSTWVTILGTNLAPLTRSWAGADFRGNLLPTRLEDVEVLFDGVAGYPYFISPGQLNVLMPDGIGIGVVKVTVRRGAAVSNASGVHVMPHAPGFFTLGAQYGNFIAAVHPDGVLVGRTGLIPGALTRPPVPGNVIQLYLSGLGDTEPRTPAAQIVASAATLRFPALIKIGGIEARVLFAGKVGSGLYQINIVVPDLPPGDYSIESLQEGILSAASALLTIGPN